MLRHISARLRWIGERSGWVVQAQWRWKPGFPCALADRQRLKKYAGAAEMAAAPAQLGRGVAPLVAATGMNAKPLEHDRAIDAHSPFATAGPVWAPQVTASGQADSSSVLSQVSA